MLPNPKTSKDSVVINLQDFAAGGGTHWVCVYRNEYFDSYGLCSPDIVETWMRKNHKDITYNSSKLQMNDSMCGYYCIYYIRERYKGRTAMDILLDFTQTPSQHNENLVKDIFV